MSAPPFDQGEVKEIFNCAGIILRGWFRGTWWEFNSQDQEWSLQLGDDWFDFQIEDRQISKRRAREAVGESLRRYVAHLNSTNVADYLRELRP
jgi:hypothetical protein